jgi:hypothetical protein
MPRNLTSPIDSLNSCGLNDHHNNAIYLVFNKHPREGPTIIFPNLKQKIIPHPWRMLKWSLPNELFSTFFTVK